MAERYKHLFLDDRFGDSLTFRPITGGPEKRIPSRDRKARGEKLVRQLQHAWEEAKKTRRRKKSSSTSY